VTRDSPDSRSASGRSLIWPSPWICRSWRGWCALASINRILKRRVDIDGPRSAVLIHTQCCGFKISASVTSRVFLRFVGGFVPDESPGRRQLLMPWTVGKDGPRRDVQFHIAAQRLVISVGRVDCSVAEHRRESEPQLTGKDSKDGLAFRAFRKCASSQSRS